MTRSLVLATQVLVLFCAAYVHAQYSATYVPGPNLPSKTEEGQAGTNACGTGSDPNSSCQNLYVNSGTDFCLWGPPGPKTEGIGAAERKVVSYCTKSGRGTRLIPPGTLKSVHFVKTPHYVQVSGRADFAKMFVNGDGGGGELDPHGEDELGNPIGGLVFTNAFGHKLVQAHEWHSFMDDESYCLRVCKDSDEAKDFCKNIYDELGCSFNMPTGPEGGNDFESCEGDDAQIVGVYTSNGQVSTFFQSQTEQGQPVPPPKPPPAVSQCTPFASSKLEGTLKNPFAYAGEASMANSYSSSSSMSSSSSSFNSTSVLLQPTSSFSSSFSSSSSSTYANFTSTSSSSSSTTTPTPSSTRSVVTVTASSSNTPISGLEFGRNRAQSLSKPTFIYVGIFLLTIVVLGSGDGFMLF